MIAFAILFLLPGTAHAFSSPANDYIDTGWKAYNAGHYEDAMRAFGQIAGDLTGGAGAGDLITRPEGWWPHNYPRLPEQPYTVNATAYRAHLQNLTQRAADACAPDARGAVGLACPDLYRPGATVAAAKKKDGSDRSARLLVLGVHSGHDASICVVDGGEVVAVLELERLFRERHFSEEIHTFARHGRFAEVWRRAYGVLAMATAATIGGRLFDVGVSVWHARERGHVRHLRDPTERSAWFARDSGWPVRQWTTADHHASHAALGFFDSPYARALVFSYDGGGNEGTFVVYLGDRSAAARGEPGAKALTIVGVPSPADGYEDGLCGMYYTFCERVPEIGGDTCAGARYCPHLPGRMMGFAALGKPKGACVDGLARGGFSRRDGALFARV